MRDVILSQRHVTNYSSHPSPPPQSTLMIIIMQKKIISGRSCCYSYPAIDVQRTAGEFVNCLLLSLLYGNNNNSFNTNITPSITKMTNNENIHDNNNYMEEEEDEDDKDRPSHKRTSTTILAAYVCQYSTSILQCRNPCALQDYILNINKVLQLLILLLYSSSSSSNYHLLLHKAIAVTV